MTPSRADHTATIIDGLAEAIRNGQPVEEFVKLYQQLCQDELKHDHAAEEESKEPLQELVLGQIHKNSLVFDPKALLKERENAASEE